MLTTAVSNDGVAFEPYRAQRPTGSLVIHHRQSESDCLHIRLLEASATESDNERSPLPLEIDTVRNIMKVSKIFVKNFNELLDVTIAETAEHEELGMTDVSTATKVVMKWELPSIAITRKTVVAYDSTM